MKDTARIWRLRRGCEGRAALERLPVMPLYKWSLRADVAQRCLMQKHDASKEVLYKEC
jgi:hypothetical protein